MTPTNKQAGAAMDIVIPSGQNLLLFAGAALVLLLIPGPAVLYVVARSVAQGRKAGIVSVLGIHTATLIHIAAAALGLSVLVLSSALAFNIVKYAGATCVQHREVRRRRIPDLAGLS